MKPHPFCLMNLALVLLLILAGSIPVSGHADLAAPISELGQPARQVDQLPLLFIPNRGQVDDRVAFYLQARDTTVYFTPDGLTFALAIPITAGSPASLTGTLRYPKSPDQLPARGGRSILKLDFLGAGRGILPQGEEQAETVVSYFKGSPDRWQAGLPTFRRLVYPNLWPGIDLVFSGEAGRLKYEFVVRPGADPGRIGLAYRGASGLTLDRAGRMEVATPSGILRDEAPVAYQEAGGRRAAVAAAYTIHAGAASSEGQLFSYTFQIGDYDPSLPLVIDPALLIYAGYIGGSEDDHGFGIAVDGSGAAYVTGSVISTEATFPVKVGPDPSFNGDRDVFVAKVRPDGGGLLYAGYIGGDQDDFGAGIAVDSSGAAYIAGSTYAADKIPFPTKGGPDLTQNGYWDAFVAKVSPNGTGLVYAGYIGGDKDDFGSSIAIDRSGAVYIAGYTSSAQATFPARVGPGLAYKGGRDAFVAKVRPGGSGLAYCGYIGGSSEDDGTGIAVDSSGAAYVAGYTYSSQATFPVSTGPDLTFSGLVEAFVAKVRPDGSGLAYAGYIGEDGAYEGFAVAVDANGAAYVAGGAGTAQSGGLDAFVARVRPDGSGLSYSILIGGGQDEAALGIALDANRAAYITGFTSSDQASFPVRWGPDLTYNGSQDAFAAKLRPDGSGLIYAGYLGGSSKDEGIGIAVDEGGAAYITGYTTSNEKSFPVLKGPDLTYNNKLDAFAAKIELIDIPFYLPGVSRR